MNIGLAVTRSEGESWRDCMVRIASAYGLEAECTAVFDRELSLGSEEGDAVWSALYEWDCLTVQQEDVRP